MRVKVVDGFKKEMFIDSLFLNNFEIENLFIRNRLFCIKIKTEICNFALNDFMCSYFFIIVFTEYAFWMCLVDFIDFSLEWKNILFNKLLLS